MMVIPALDLREGACVQLVGGRYEDERVRLDDPVGVARTWARAGFHRLHVVDLDAATGRGSNAAVIDDLLAERAFELQVGGGVRNLEDIRRLLEAGATRVVIGTRAIGEPLWLARAVSEFPDRLLVAVDVSGRTVLTHGWQRAAEHQIGDLIDELNELPLAGVLVTAVHREGRLEGTDLPLMLELTSRSRLPLFAAGGIRNLDELRVLSEIGVHAAILGMALYSGALEPQELVEEFVA
jgi:phosphoribosylformimino-5-aminoimidazole carboxamide ribotide isomerase